MASEIKLRKKNEPAEKKITKESLFLKNSKMKSCFFLELPRYTYRVNSKLFTEIKYLGTTYLYLYIKIAENNSLINNLSNIPYIR